MGDSSCSNLECLDYINLVHCIFFCTRAISLGMIWKKKKVEYKQIFRKCTITWSCPKKEWPGVKKKKMLKASPCCPLGPQRPERSKRRSLVSSLTKVGQALQVGTGVAAPTPGCSDQWVRIQGGGHKKGDSWPFVPRNPSSAHSRISFTAAKEAVNWWLDGAETKIVHGKFLNKVTFKVNSYLQSALFLLLASNWGFLSSGKSDHSFLFLYLPCTWQAITI